MTQGGSVKDLLNSLSRLKTVQFVEWLEMNLGKPYFNTGPEQNSVFRGYTKNGLLGKRMVDFEGF